MAKKGENIYRRKDGRWEGRYRYSVYKNTDHSQRFKYYLNKKHPDVQITVFDNYEDASASLQKEKYDVVLFDGTFDDISFDEISSKIGSAVFAYVSETNEIIDDKETLFKYRGVSEIYSKICELYEKKKKRTIKRSENTPDERKKTEIITFIPANGGAGSSTMAAACAIALSNTSPTLYINLEQRTSDQAFFSSDNKKGITEIAALLKTKYSDSALYQMIRDSISQDTKQHGSKVFYIKGFNNIMEYTSLAPNGIETLFKALREKFDYGSVIIDTDFIVNDNMKKIILLSDKVTVVSSGSDIADVKLSKLKRYFEIISREAEDKMPEKYLILNQYYGSENEQSSLKDMELIARLARYRTDSKAEKTISDAAGDLEGYVTDYIEDQVDAVQTSIESIFISPLTNKLTPIMTLVSSGNGDIDKIVEKGLEEAFNTIGANINAMEDGTIKDLALKFYNTKAKELKEDLKTKLMDYFNEILAGDTANVPSLNDLLAGEKGILTEPIHSFREDITKELGKIKDEIMTDIRNATDKSASEIKSYIHEKTDEAAEKITGKVTDVIDDKLSSKMDQSFDTSASSGGFTLNYKEYCKIFVLMQLMFNETKMLQRAAVLIQANVAAAPDSHGSSNASFQMVEANTLVSVNATIRMTTLFPWIVEDNVDDAAGTADIGLDLSSLGSNSVKINYSGMNGY
ncbi:MAG: hypothetical protein IJ071_09710 [Ruminococcus sp.]|nr:hypothetical protein [Ruminococcus sp.]